MGVQIKGSTGFSSALNTRKTYGVCSHVAITRLSQLIVNTAAGCYSHGQALGLNAVIPTHFCTMFWLGKGECSESFKSERFTMIVAQVVNCGEMFDNSNCANNM